MAYNTGFTRRKSSGLFDTDCRTTGTTRPLGGPSKTVTYYAEHTLDEAIEAGECISMVRVHKGFKVTGVTVAWTIASTTVAIAGTIVGFGDPFCCGRLSNRPLDFRRSSADGTCAGSFQSCGTLTKIGRIGDGCGIGYTYTCETDLILTNLYGIGSHYQGGFGTGQPSGGGVFGDAIPSGTVVAVEVRGIQTGG